MVVSKSVSVAIAQGEHHPSVRVCIYAKSMHPRQRGSGDLDTISRENDNRPLANGGLLVDGNEVVCISR
jgi:hypothetical protein